MIGAVTRYNHEGLHVTGTELTFTGLEHTETNQVVNPYSNCTCIMYLFTTIWNHIFFKIHNSLNNRRNKTLLKQM